MNTKLIGGSLLVAAGLVGTLHAAAQGNDGALLTLKVSSEALPVAGKTERASVESSVLVAFNEKFAMQVDPFRVEVTAAHEESSAGVTVTLFDARTEPAVLVGTQTFSVPAAGSGAAHMTGTDGTSYAVAVQFKLARLPAGKP